MQNDLISRSALIAHIGDLGNDPEDDTTFLTVGQACAIAHKSIVDMIKAAPAVDAVEVVRCRDCVYYKQNPYNSEDIDLMCQYWADWIPMGDDDFCSCGEKKER